MLQAAKSDPSTEQEVIITVHRRLQLLLATLITGGIALTLATSQPASSAATRLRLEIVAPQSRNGVVEIAIRVEEATDLGAWELDIAFDPTLVSVSGLALDPTFGNSAAVCQAGNERCALGLGPVVEGNTVSVGAVSYGTGAGVTGDATLAVLYLRSRGMAGKLQLEPIGALITDVNATATTPDAEGVTLSLVGEQYRLHLPLLEK